MTRTKIIKPVVESITTTISTSKWCVVGKGPSFDNVSQEELSEFSLITLNHACQFANAEFCHFVDMEALLDCFPRLAGKKVIMPWYPHVKMKPTSCTLEEVIQQFPDTVEFFSYNASVHHKRTPNTKLPRILLSQFSATAVFSILAKAGAKEIWSVGVDGGTGYARSFDHKDKLKNGQSSFDSQFPILEKICKSKNVTWHRLGVTEDV